MHHGTMLIKFFYVKALEDFAEKQERGEKATLVDEEDFRYPGPRPNSKETGILMLADAVEAVSHTIDTNDRDELETVIDKIVEDRLIDKQLDECDLTMPELTLIKESFVKNLLGTGHQRVKYKDVPREDTQREVETQDTNATNNGESSAEPILSPTTTTT
jgi:membrane-associated HD superfamily phosphohydrolase